MPFNGPKPLFKGATRVARVLGVPRSVALMIFMFSAAFFMLIHFWALMLMMLLWSLAAALTRYDDRMLNILSLWLKTKGLNSLQPVSKYWGGSTYSPVDYQRKDLD